MKTDGLEEKLKTVFSLLSPEQAEEARTNLLKRYREQKNSKRFEFQWADFTTGGKFLRGGVSNILNQRTGVITNSQENHDIFDIVRFAQDNRFSAGSSFWDSKKPCFYWLLPITASNIDQVSTTQLRGLAISPAVFSEIFKTFNLSAGLSEGEERVVFQLTVGVDLRQAAKIDGISYETKRAHVKRACEKLFCNSQKDIIRKVLGQMVHFLTLSDGEAAHAKIAEEFLAEHLSDDLRLSIQRQENGQLIRFFECGPPTGQPVIMIHGMMFPVILSGLSKYLEAASIRLIIPIRSGFMEFPSTSGRSKGLRLIDTSLRSISLFIEQNHLSPALIVGQSLGAIVALRFATTYPHLVSRLVLLSLNLPQSKPSAGNSADTFYGAMSQFANHSELFNLINQQYTGYYARESTCREMLSRLFGASAIDMDVLEGKFAGTPTYKMFAKTYQTSTYGMTADFSYTMQSWQHNLKPLAIPVTVIHGKHDPLTQPEELDQICEVLNISDVFTVKTGGHFITISHAKTVWLHIAKLAKS